MATDAARRTPFYAWLQWLGRLVWKLTGGTTEVSGLENVPMQGAALIISNHQSVLDPILTQAIIPRTVHAMAKSTQFNVPGIGWIMRHICVFPVRRFQIDPQAVRHSLRLLSNGGIVAVYIEGERAWNGQLQEPRHGTVRMAIRAGVPIIICAVTGTYEVWPRWSSRPRPGPIRIRFLPPIQIPQLRGQANRDAVPDATGRIMSRLREALQTAID
jgi:1-acyl-sn-glycerol-3-phosphate acyltransferase